MNIKNASILENVLILCILSKKLNHLIQISNIKLDYFESLILVLSKTKLTENLVFIEEKYT